nr:probable glutamate receptor [Cherax quadricarinatus]
MAPISTWLHLGKGDNTSEASPAPPAAPPPPPPPHVTCTQPWAFQGFLVDMLNVLSSQMNFTYTLYEVCDGAYGSEVIGRWTGVVGEVVYSHAHIGLANLGVNYARSSVVTFPRISTSYGGAGIVFHRLHKNCSSNLAVYFLPFSINVWACICVSVPVAALAIHLTTRPRSSLRVWLHRRQHRKRCHQQGVHLTQVFNTTAPSVLGQHPTPRPSIHSLQQQNTLKAGRKDKTETSLKLDDRGRERKEEAVSFFNGVWFAATVLMQQDLVLEPLCLDVRSLSGRVV